VRGDGHHAILAGSFQRADGKTIARAIWSLTVSTQGIELRMTKPPKARMHATAWLDEGAPRLSARAAHIGRRARIVTASGWAFPTTLHWGRGRSASLKLGL
jgi:hypothetical protein